MDFSRFHQLKGIKAHNFGRQNNSFCLHFTLQKSCFNLFHAKITHIIDAMHFVWRSNFGFKAFWVSKFETHTTTWQKVTQNTTKPTSPSDKAVSVIQWNGFTGAQFQPTMMMANATINTKHFLAEQRKREKERREMGKREMIESGRVSTGKRS